MATGGEAGAGLDGEETIGREQAEHAARLQRTGHGLDKGVIEINPSGQAETAGQRLGPSSPRTCVRT